MRIGADHAGCELKEHVKAHLLELRHRVIDLGTHSVQPVQGVEHDDMNVLVIGGRVIGESGALEQVGAFLNAKYTAEERHQRRLAKVKAIERRFRGERQESMTSKLD